MPNRLDLPDEFQHLIEKREGERRQLANEEGAVEEQQPPTGEERRKVDRRKEDRAGE